jgi:putative flippase GtrA
MNCDINMSIDNLIMNLMKKFLLYGFNGIINTIVTYGLFLLISNYIDYRITIALVYIPGVYLSYVLNGRITFKSKGCFGIFVIISIAMFFTNLVITWTLVQDFHVTKELSQLFAIGVVFIIGFLLNKRFSFSSIRHNN